MSIFDYDLFVIGGGSGGVRAARLAAGLGKKTAVAEEFRYGGTCVIRGCVPKKLLVYASHFSEDFEAAAGFGWRLAGVEFDWPTLIANKDEEINRLEGLYEKGLTSAGATVLKTRAELRGPHEIFLSATDETVTAERIIVATGGTPSGLEDLPGRDLCITSNEVFHLERLPERVVINGGGYIAVEFASIFSGLGSQVTLVYRGEEILRGFDDDLREALHHELVTRGVDVRCGTTFKSVEGERGAEKRVLLSGGTQTAADEVLLATGRKPATVGLGLEHAGVKTDESGGIIVDEYSRSSVSSIWGLGDVTNRVALTPVAIHEAMCFIESEYKDNPIRPDHAHIPTAVFSQPEIGTIGLSEADAAGQYKVLEVYRAQFRPMKNTLSGAQDQMLMKIICDGGSRRVVGIHLLGSGSGELIQALGIAVKMGATKDDFDRTMAVHPTAAEELVTMYQPSYRIVDGERLES